MVLRIGRSYRVFLYKFLNAFSSRSVTSSDISSRECTEGMALPLDCNISSIAALWMFVEERCRKMCWLWSFVKGAW